MRWLYMGIKKAERPGMASLHKTEYASPPGRSLGVRAFLFGSATFDLPCHHQMLGLFSLSPLCSNPFARAASKVMPPRR